jgi:hypothetical protein
MRIEWLYWKDHIVEKILFKHGVQPIEVEEMILDGTPEVRKEGDRYLLYGQTRAGRYLFAVLDKGEESGIFVPVTARDMSENEKHAFKKRRGTQ